jgi:predicted transcriptional regulator
VRRYLLPVERPVLEWPAGLAAQRPHEVVVLLRDGLRPFDDRVQAIGIAPKQDLGACEVVAPDDGDCRPVTAHPGEGGLTLTRQEVDVMASMVKSPAEAMLLLEVAAGSGYSRNTTRKYLSRLLDAGLVHRPHGPRKGYAVTDAGRKLLASTRAAKRQSKVRA